MPSLRHIHLEFPEAKRLADLSGMEWDLKACVSYCEALLRGEGNDADLARELTKTTSLSISAFISYGRCFKGGVRRETELQLGAGITDADRPSHEELIAIRDKFVAHSVNDLEHHRARVWLYPEGGREGVFGVTVESLYEAVLPSRTYEQLIQLCQKHLQWIETEMNNESAKLKDILLQRYSLEQLYAMGPKRTPPIDPAKVFKPRKYV